MNGMTGKPSTAFADSVLEAYDLSEFDAVELHGVRAEGDEVAIDNVAPERFSTYFRRPTGSPVRCGDFREVWAAQEYAAELSDQYNLPVVDHVLAAIMCRDAVESTEHMICLPGM